MYVCFVGVCVGVFDSFIVFEDWSLILTFVEYFSVYYIVIFSSTLKFLLPVFTVLFSFHNYSKQKFIYFTHSTLGHVNVHLNQSFKIDKFLIVVQKYILKQRTSHFVHSPLT